MKPNNPQTSPKTYWYIIKSCYNGRKIPIIPPLSLNRKIVTSFKEKRPTFLTNIFLLNAILHQMTINYQKFKHILQKLSPSNIEEEDIYKIIKTLDINKTHGNDEVSIRMLKLCDKSIVKPLSIIFNNCKLNKTFPNIWKKSNVVPIHKKGDKDVIKKLLPSFTFNNIWKNFERLIFNSLFKYIDENELLNLN